MNVSYLLIILMCSLVLLEAKPGRKRQKTCAEHDPAKEEEEEKTAQKAVCEAKEAQAIVSEKLQQVQQLSEAIREAQSVIEEETEGLSRLRESYKASCIATKTSQKEVEHLRKSYKMAKIILSKLLPFQSNFDAQIVKTTQLIEFAKKKISELFSKLQVAEKQLCKAKENAKQKSEKANKCMSGDNDNNYDFDIM